MEVEEEEEEEEEETKEEEVEKENEEERLMRDRKKIARTDDKIDKCSPGQQTIQNHPTTCKFIAHEKKKWRMEAFAKIMIIKSII